MRPYFIDGRGYSAPFPVETDVNPRLQYIGVDGPVTLNIGSGVNPIPGAINCDLQPFPGVNKIFDFTQPWPADPACVDKVTMFQCLEHVPPLIAFEVVKEAYRVLRPTGVLIVEVPDMRGMCQEYLNGNAGMLVGAIFGGYDHPADAHRYGYTADSLALLCHLAGFGRVYTGPGTDYHAGQIPTLRIEAVKLLPRAEVIHPPPDAA